MTQFESLAKTSTGKILLLANYRSAQYTQKHPHQRCRNLLYPIPSIVGMSWEQDGRRG